MTAHVTGSGAGGITDQLVAWSLSLRWRDVDEHAQQAARRHLLDTLGCLIAGSRQALTARVRETLAAVRTGGDTPVPGHGQTHDLLDATYLAGVAAHGLELDDGYREGSTHPGAVVIPAALATAWHANANVETLLEAVVIGYETMTLIARLAHPAMRRKGFHPTATSGVFGAVLAAAHLRQLDAGKRRHALGLAASSAAGLFAFVSGGADVKRLHPGHAAREGVFAALLAERGLEGPPAVLEGVDGFFQAYAEPQAAATSFALPPHGPWGVAGCYLKPYPCCRHLHPAIDAVFALRAEHGLQAAEIDRAEIETYTIAAEHARIGWQDFASSQLSFPFVIATALRHGAVALPHFGTAARQDAATLALCGRVQITASDAMDEIYRHGRPARVTLHARGQTFTAERHEALGSPPMPMTMAAVEVKFMGLTRDIIGAVQSQRLLDHIAAADGQSPARNLIALTLPKSEDQFSPENPHEQEPATYR